MNAREAVMYLRLCLKQWSNTPDVDEELMVVALNAGIREICWRLRPVSTCARNEEAIPAPTSVSNVLERVIFSVNTATGSTYEAKNKTYLAMKALFFVGRDEALIPVPDYKVMASTDLLLEKALENNTPSHFAVIPRSRFDFNIHLWPPPNGIPALALQAWYYYIPGPLTSMEQEIELSDKYMNLLWPYCLNVLTPKQAYEAKFEMMVRQHLRHRQTEGKQYVQPLTGL